MGGWQGCVVLAATLAIGPVLGGCATIQGGPKRLYTADAETGRIRGQLERVNLAEFSSLDEAARMNYRNDWIAARMYVIDIQYTAYEAALTKERQNVGFGAAATTIGLTTASGLIAPVATKNLLTLLAGAVTGARAAYDDDILLAHSMQWIQSQMRTQRTRVAERILRGLKLSTVDYPLAQALSDLEDYYRAGTFTGGLIATNETIGAEAKFTANDKDERIEVTYASTATGRALRACLLQPGVTQQKLVNLMKSPSQGNFALMLVGQLRSGAQDLLATARSRGICR